MRRHVVTALSALIGGIGTWTCFLYLAAPVANLRGVLTYTPPFSDAPRQIGLGLPDNTTLHDMPVELILATLISEDREFHTHHGFRPNKIYAVLKRSFVEGRRLQGISTLTQQIAKNVFTGAERSWSRKYVELIYAIKIEHNFTKEDIFTLYVSMAETGPGLYGYRQAARMYFAKDVPQLDIAESAFIVSNLPSPVRYSEAFRQGRSDDDAQARMSYIIGRVLALRRMLIPASGLTDEQKTTFFSGYLRQKRANLPLWLPGNAVYPDSGPLIDTFRQRYGLAD